MFTAANLRRSAALAVCFATALASAAAPRKLSVAAAADLQFALTDLAQQFRKAHPDIDLQTAFGSSGNFFAQIGNQAPFDIFLSADIDYPRRLVESKLAVADSLYVYGTGHLVVWVPKSSPIDVAKLKWQSLEAPSVKHIAIANPQHAPYGRAAEAALRKTGIYDRVASKLVLGENIAQTFQFAQSGAADAGIVAMALVLAPTAKDQGRYWEVPQDSYPKLEQAAVLLTHAANSADARTFLEFLKSDSARRSLRGFGFY